MQYYVIEEFNIENGVVINTPVKYSANEEYITTLNSQKNGLIDFYNWISLNAVDISNGIISPAEFIINNGVVEGSVASCDFIPEGLEEVL